MVKCLHNLALIGFCQLALFSLAVPASAEELTFSFSDQVGDATGPASDIVGMSMTFDNITGDYLITWQADDSKPFGPLATGKLFFNTNVFNADVGTTGPISFFGLHSEFTPTMATSTWIISGNDPVLATWDLGDRVAADSTIGNPDGIGMFGSSAGVSNGRISLGWDQLGPDQLGTGPFTTLQSIPEPTGMVLTMLGVLLMTPFFHTRKIS